MTKAQREHRANVEENLVKIGLGQPASLALDEQECASDEEISRLQHNRVGDICAKACLDAGIDHSGAAIWCTTMVRLSLVDEAQLKGRLDVGIAAELIGKINILQRYISMARDDINLAKQLITGETK